MITHDLIQGTPEWHAFRASHLNASDAPAMMGVSPYKSRGELMKERATGVVKEVDAATQRRFDDGHRFEALARPLAERLIGEELYPVVGSNGKYAASFDGINLLETICFEHKTLNDDIRACQDVYELPMCYLVQMEHQLMVSGAEKCLFMATKWDGDSLVESAYFWYLPQPELREVIVLSWEQFEKDLADFRARETATAPVGKAPDALPALRIEVTGAVTASNLAEYKAFALDVLANINTKLETDEDFASADKTTKWCKDVEERLEAAKQHALSQTSSIDELFRTIDAIKEEARQKRLKLEMLVKERKNLIRIERVADYRSKFLSHVAILQAEIAGVRFEPIQPDFGGAIKGLKTLASIDNALETALANAKIAADAMAKDLRARVTWFNQNAAEFRFLVPDLQQLVVKPFDDFTLTITSRIEQHNREIDRREQERKAAEQRAAELRAAEQQPQLSLTTAEATCDALMAEHMPVPDKPKTSPPTLKLGTINDRLGFTLTVDFLRSLGFEAHVEKSSRLYHESDFVRICQALIGHIKTQATQGEEAPAKAVL